MLKKPFVIFMLTFSTILCSLGVYLYFDFGNSENSAIDNQILFNLPETSWLRLLPEEDIKALEEMPAIEHYGAELEGGFTNEGGLKQAEGLPEVMYSNKTVANLDGKLLRLGGYPVPLELNEKGEVLEFFLVPYPGACIHVPPPPPNQLIWVKSEKPFKVENIYYPIWVVGTLKIEQVSNKLGDAAYTMQALGVRDIEEDDPIAD